jgi:tRNA/tmRNA/rRNA uracil-C5-methylase (TrmA/RlmC/RlmD family)
VEQGSILDVVIERIVPGGAGMGHAEGLTIFVPDTAPGDLARVRIDRVRGRTAFGTVLEVLTPSPDRVALPDPERDRCGGNDFRHLRYETQLAAKTAIIQDCLRRIAQVEWDHPLHVVPSPLQWRYRARAEWAYDRETGALGYRERQSHRICDVERDETLREELEAALQDLRHRLRAGLVRPAPEFRGVVGDNGVDVVPTDRLVKAKVLEVAIAGLCYQFDAYCFFQANYAILPAMIEEVQRLAEAAPALPHHVGRGTYVSRRVAVELYCGVGLLTLALAPGFDRFHGVEAQHRSATFAKRNAAAAGLEQVRIAAVPAEIWLAERGRAVDPVSLLVVDPPRGGMEAETLRGVIRLRPARIIYVSCDPATFSRDLKALVASGYVLDAITGFDMFPQTHHVETVAHLRLDEDAAGEA